MCKIKGRKQQLVTLGPDTVLREHTVNELLCVQYGVRQEEGEHQCMAVKQVCPLLFTQRYYRIKILQCIVCEKLHFKMGHKIVKHPLRD